MAEKTDFMAQAKAQMGAVDGRDEEDGRTR